MIIWHQFHPFAQKVQLWSDLYHQDPRFFQCYLFKQVYRCFVGLVLAVICAPLIWTNQTVRHLDGSNSLMNSSRHLLRQSWCLLFVAQTRKHDVVDLWLHHVTRYTFDYHCLTKIGHFQYLDDFCPYVYC